MLTTVKSESSSTHRIESSFVSPLSVWAQQGVQSFFAAQRIFMDLVIRQNASVMHSLRQHLSDPRHSPTVILGEVIAEGMASLIEAQKVLLELGEKQNEILMSGVKERVGDWPPAQAITDLLRRSVETFLHMQQECLKIAGKQTHTWMEAAKAGKPYQTEHVVELAREAMDSIVKTQKHFMDVIAEETAKTTGGKRSKCMKKMKKTELAQLARRATESFMGAQKKLVDVAGRQMNASVKLAGNPLDFLRPFPFLPLAELTREGVKSYVVAQRELLDVIAKPAVGHKRLQRDVKRLHKKPAAAAA